jgi:RimJ/RimL family protein N-acetyltransferase
VRVRLRPVEPADLPLFFEHQRDPVAVAMVAFNSRDRAAFDQHWSKILADPANLIRTVVAAPGVSPESGAAGVPPESAEQVAGHICSWTSNEQREIGYWIDRAFWGRGIGTAALSAFLRLEQTRPLYAGVAKHNTASIRVLQKCGFTFHADDESHVILVLRGKSELGITN